MGERHWGCYMYLFILREVIQKSLGCMRSMVWKSSHAGIIMSKPLSAATLRHHCDRFNGHIKHNETTVFSF